MKVKRKIIEIDEDLCDGCGNCIVACAEGAMEIVDGKAKIIKDLLCDGLGACIGDCPTDALKIIEREADEFDEEAVHVHLKKMEESKGVEVKAMGGCPGTQIQTLGANTETACDCANKPSEISGGASALTHWPIQIRLVPPNAPFLKGSDLLITADCVPVSYPSLHQDFLKGRTIMMGCPKFDDPDEYIAKFTEIFKTAELNSVTVLLMEVPCCSGLSGIVKKAKELSGSNVSVKDVVVGLKGNIL